VLNLTTTCLAHCVEVGFFWCAASAVFGDLAVRGIATSSSSGCVPSSDDDGLDGGEPFPLIVQVRPVIHCSTGGLTGADPQRLSAGRASIARMAPIRG